MIGLSPFALPIFCISLVQKMPIHTKIYAVHVVRPGDRWEWKWEGTIPLADGAQDVSSKGSLTEWVTDASPMRKSGSTGRVLHVHTEERRDRDDRRNRPAEVSLRSVDLVSISLSGASTTMEAKVEIGGEPGLQKAISDVPSPARYWSGLVFSGETKFRGGSVERWKEVYGKLVRVRVPAGEFDCLRFTSDDSTGKTSVHTDGYYCPALARRVKYTDTQSSPEGTFVLHYELVSTNIR